MVTLNEDFEVFISSDQYKVRRAPSLAWCPVHSAYWQGAQHLPASPSTFAAGGCITCHTATLTPHAHSCYALYRRLHVLALCAAKLYSRCLSRRGGFSTCTSPRSTTCTRRRWRTSTAAWPSSQVPH